MFFVQPLVRGWARYKRRLVVAQPNKSAVSMESQFAPATNPICFWSRGTARYTFIDEIQNDLKKAGWEHRIDSGWDEFDVEISTNRWSTSQLTTVHEELAEGRRFFRCRIDTRTSWTSRLLVALLAVGSSFAILFARETLPYVWFAMALIPLALLFVATEERAQSNAIAVLISNAACRLNFEEWKDEASQHKAAIKVS